MMLSVLVVAFAAAGAAGPVQEVEKIEPVAVVGCLQKAAPGTWMLVNASAPLPSSANAPSDKELAALPRSGKQQFQLVGATALFNLPAHRDQSVVVKGLPLKGAKVGQLNVTSVSMIVATCPAASSPK